MSAMPNLSLSPSKTREAIVRCLQARLVSFIRSSPGLGKSDIIHNVADQFRLKEIDFRLSQCDVTDLNGLPNFTNDGRAQYMPFADFPLEGDEPPEGYDGWLLFFDELNAAPKQLQAAAYKILLERKVGNRSLHNKVVMVCAGNLDTDMAVAYSLSTALQSRLIHIEMHVDLHDWVTWAIKANIDSRIIGFIEFRPNMLHDFDPQHSDKTFPCPRTWEFLDKLTRGQDIGMEDLALFAGTVGPGAAQEFIQFARIYTDLPRISEILADPKGARLPTEPSVKYAMATVLAERMRDTNAKELVEYLERLPVECRVLCIRMVHIREPSLVRHPAIQDLFTRLVTYM